MIFTPDQPHRSIFRIAGRVRERESKKEEKRNEGREEKLHVLFWDYVNLKKKKPIPLSTHTLLFCVCQDSGKEYREKKREFLITSSEEWIKSDQKIRGEKRPTV